MHKAHEIARVFEETAPLETGNTGDELGFVFGDQEQSVRAIGCLWHVDAQSINACIERNINMIITHEGIFLPEQNGNWYDGPDKDNIHANILRERLLSQHQMVVYRSHSNWDALPVDGVPDQAVLSLGIKGLQELSRQKYFSVQEIPDAMSVGNLKERVEAGTEFPFCRIYGDSEKTIKRFAFLVGGFGSNQYHMPQVARDMGAEAVIIGEMLEVIVIACLEMGMPVIESLHSASEIPAIKRQADILAERFSQLPVHYIHSGAMAFGRKEPDIGKNR